MRVAPGVDGRLTSQREQHAGSLRSTSVSSSGPGGAGPWASRGRDSWPGAGGWKPAGWGPVTSEHALGGRLAEVAGGIRSTLAEGLTLMAVPGGFHLGFWVEHQGCWGWGPGSEDVPPKPAWVGQGAQGPC